MSSKKQAGGSRAGNPGSRVVCRNRRALHNYEILDQVECGIQLVGSEVKSIRDSHINIEEAFARIEKGEVWLFNVDISEYAQASYLNHERRRTRKLLLKKREVARIIEKAEQKGNTLIPLEVYFSERGFVKVTLAVARGKKEYDKRQKILKHEDQRAVREALKRRP